MATYSIGTAPTDATKLQDFNSVLNILPDNTSKLIAPKDVRDSFYTTWENIAFKPTTAGGSEYIGVDQTSLQEKILLGKKSVGGQYVMNTSLLATDVDVFFYNTKTEPQIDYHTTVAFLAGTGSNVDNFGNIFSPYVKSTVVNNSPYSNTIDFEVRNPSYYDDGFGTFSGGNINIRSEYGFVTLNGLRMPTFTQNTVGASNDGYVLKYRYYGGQAYAQWEASASASTADTLYSTGTVSITGSPVLLNGQPIDFTSSVPVPQTIGGVPSGTTFSSMPLTEVVRMILYPYISPTLTTSMVYSLIEMGDSTTENLQRMNLTIVKNATYSVTSLTSIPTYNLQLPTLPISNGTTTGLIQPVFSTIPYRNDSPPTSYVVFSRTTQLVDNYPSTASSVVNFTSVIPWFYGSATISTATASGINSINNILGTSSSANLGKLNKQIYGPALSSSTSYNKTVLFSTSGLPQNQGYLYFGYPGDYPDLVQIIDQNGFNMFGSWKKFVINNVTSPNSPSWWSGKKYKFYIFVGPVVGASVPLITQVGSLSSNYSANFQFKFA